jgi:hypothetical protein
MKGLGLLFSLILSVLVVAPLSAQFVRLEVDEIDNQGMVPGRTFRVFAVFENAGDILDAVYGEKTTPLEVTTTTTFYQHERGGALSTEVQKYDKTVAPELEYDSWVTIGLEDNYMNALSGFIMDFGEFDTKGGTLATNNGAWFVTPDKRQSMAGPSKRILLMQLTTDGVINGIINLHGRTKAIYDENKEQIGGGIEIKAEGLTFVAGN